VEVIGQTLEWDACGVGSTGQVVDLARHTDADGVAEADLVDAELEQAQPDLHHTARVDPAGERATEGRRHVAAFPPAQLARPGEYRLERNERVVDAHADVARREGVAGGGEDGECVGARRDGAIEPALIGYEYGIAHVAALGPERPHHVIGVGELRDGRRRNEAGRLYLGQAGAAQQRDVLKLGVGGNRRRFVLQAVARPDFVDAYTRR
jgi:hypothetical protein